MLSQVTYERLAGTNVLQDFVELPSQIFEHWAFEPEVLKRHALHHETGAANAGGAARASDRCAASSTRASRRSSTFPVRSSTWRCMRRRIRRASTSRRSRKASSTRIGMPREIVMRHRLPHFGHLFSGRGVRGRLLRLHVGGGARLPTPTTRSSRPGTYSIRPRRSGSIASCIRPAARWIPHSRSGRSAAANQRWSRCSSSAGSSRKGPQAAPKRSLRRLAPSGGGL